MKQIILFYFLVFSLWKSHAPAGRTFPLCSFMWMRVMPPVYFLPPPPVRCLLLLGSALKKRWITAEELPALPFTHFTHTHTPLLHYQSHPWGNAAHVCARIHTHTHTHTHTHPHTGLKALTGLLAKGQSQESDKSFFLKQRKPLISS